MPFGSLFSSKSRSETLSSAANVIEGDGDSLLRQTLNLSGIKVGKKADFTLATSDFGAIEAGRQAQKEALDFAAESNQSASDFAAGAQAVAATTVQGALGLVEARSQSEAAEGIGKLFNLGMVAVVVIGAVMIWKG